MLVNKFVKLGDCHQQQFHFTQLNKILFSCVKIYLFDYIYVQ